MMPGFSLPDLKGQPLDVARDLGEVPINLISLIVTH